MIKGNYKRFLENIVKVFGTKCKEEFVKTWNIEKLKQNPRTWTEILNEVNTDLYHGKLSLEKSLRGNYEFKNQYKL